jgi:hypothetical protein
MIDRISRPRHRGFLLVLLCALSACAPAARDDSTPPAPAPLIGAWRSKLQFSSGAFEPIKNLEFMYVFNGGGTLTESSNYDGAPPVPPAYGVWRQLSPEEFEAKYAFYITQPPKRFADITSGAGWLPNGHGVFTERIRLSADGQSFESSISYSAFDSLGAPAAGGGEATGRGTRIGF